VYEFTIKTDLIDYSTPSYTEKNLHFEVPILLTANDVFNELIEEFMQFKLESVGLIAYPRSVNGTDPSNIWIFLDMQNESSFNYSAMPLLQGSRKISVKTPSTTYYRLSGRQTDFGMWKDTRSVTSYDNNLSIRLHSATYPDEHKHWTFQLVYILKFRGFRLPQNTLNKVIDGDNKDEKINFGSHSSDVVSIESKL
jgi:hypothetical protein